MKTYTNLFTKLCSEDNLYKAYRKARKGKSKKIYVTRFESNLNNNLSQLKKELEEKTYYPSNLNKFVIRDPKTRIIHASIFRDRVVHHAIVNILEPIYENIFIYDSFASRKNKGVHEAVDRFEGFVRRVSGNGKLVKQPFNRNSITGYVLKADIRKYFDTMHHEVLISILRRKIKDEDFIDIVKILLNKFETEQGKGLPLGNYTSQFFANVYLNELDYFIKHALHAKYYIRYVDDFVILHRKKQILEKYLKKIEEFMIDLKINLHPDKSEIHALRNGLVFLGYKVFYNYRRLRKRNVRYFMRKLTAYEDMLKAGLLTEDEIKIKLTGWFGYAQHANTYQLRKRILGQFKKHPIFLNVSSDPSKSDQAFINNL